MPEVEPIASDLTSWNRLPLGPPARQQPIAWRDEIAPNLRPASKRSVLPYGNGRTYGDVCLNHGNLILPMRGLNRILAYDRAHGTITAEAGMTFRELLAIIVPDGWFPPVTPGTSHLTLGGAVANDVHGKDHPTAGTFGRHLLELELHRSDEEGPIACSPRERAELFCATIGGLGLTGLIRSVTFPLQRIAGPLMETRSRRGDCLAMFAAAPDPAFPHRIAWLDASAPPDELGRGIFTEGRFTTGAGSGDLRRMLPSPPLPSGLLGPALFRVLNRLRYLAPIAESEDMGYEPFFYPLDQIDNWQRAYGPAGFYQHQSLIPDSAGSEPIRALLRALPAHGQMSFVTVLKKYGVLSSPGMMSFPRAGLSLALDLPNLGDRTLRLLDTLDEIVVAAGGRIYPAKDARMSPDTFRAGYPQWEAFTKFIDPAFSSGFLRRMNESNGTVAA
jgi:FAD/FMN-containing dehydrogenase